jgi:hypothetical protein
MVSRGLLRNRFGAWLGEPIVATAGGNQLTNAQIYHVEFPRCILVEIFSMSHQAVRTVSCLLAVALSATCVLVHGCGGSNPAPTAGDRELRNAMILLGREYGGYLAEKGAAPPNEEALRLYLQSRLIDLVGYGVKSADDLLRAGRDGQPLKAVVGRSVPPADRPEHAWAAYEPSSTAGKRLACDSRGGVYELTDEEFAKQLGDK